MVELTVINYLLYLGLAFFFGLVAGLGIWFAYAELKREVAKEAKKEARKR